jgi:hypothetical protein
MTNGKGWYGDIPGHKAASIKAQTNGILRQPMEPKIGSKTHYIARITKQGNKIRLIEKEWYEQYKDALGIIIISQHEVLNFDEYTSLNAKAVQMDIKQNDDKESLKAKEETDKDNELLKHFKPNLSLMLRGRILKFLKENAMKLNDGRVLPYAEWIDHVIKTNAQKSFSPLIEKNLNYVWNWDETKWMKL